MKNQPVWCVFLLTGIFKDNILFVTVTRSANISFIVQKIFNLQLPDIHNDDDAINFMEYLLKKKGSSPILLVLDDVWLGWESIIDNLSFTLPYYKILVTSRFSFPRFSPVYNLKILNDQDAMTLFCNSALPKDGSSKIPYDLVEKVGSRTCFISTYFFAKSYTTYTYICVEYWSTIMFLL